MTLAVRLARAIDPGLMTKQDETLIEETRAAWPSLAAADLDRGTLAQIALQRGIDHATALFYARLCELPEQQAFLEFLCASSRPSLERSDCKLLVVPAALYREFPGYRGEGSDFIAAAARLHLEAEVIPVGSLAGLHENAAILASAVERQTHPNLILATLSKGGADARWAFEAGLIPPGRIRAWLQVGGVLRGTPLASSIIHGNWLRRAAIHGYLRSRGGSRLLVSDLSHGDGTLLSKPPIFNPGLGIFNVVGFPLVRHLAGSSRRRHARLAPLGPNDAMTLLADAIIQPGFVWPLWGANHYFQIPNLASLIERVLAYICRADSITQSHPLAAAALETSLAVRP